MSGSDDQMTKKEQSVDDDQSTGCSEMLNIYPERLLYGTQSTDSNQSTTQEICDIIIEVNNDQDTSNSRQIAEMRMDNKAAERNRLYRQRHREEINQRRRELRHRKKTSHQLQTLPNIENINEIEHITTSDNQLRSNSHTQRQQRYYERNREEINKRRRERRLQQNMLQVIPATAAERNRKYRDRNRQKINERRRYNRMLQRNPQRVRTQYNTYKQHRRYKTNYENNNNQQNLNSSNDNIVQEITQDSNSSITT